MQLYTILMSHADDLQAVSVDEALIDVTTAVRQLPTTSEKQDPAKAFALMLRSEIKSATGCDGAYFTFRCILIACPFQMHKLNTSAL